MNKYQEALNWVKWEFSGCYATDNWFKKKNECIDSLQEVVDKQNKRKPWYNDYGGIGNYHCPNCDRIVFQYGACNNCGQLIDWSDD